MCILVAFYYIALQEGDIVSVWIWGDLFEELMYAHYLVAVLSIPPFYFFFGNKVTASYRHKGHGYAGGIKLSSTLKKICS